MALGQKLEEALRDTETSGAAVPRTLSVSAGELGLDVDLAALDSMSCAFEELRLRLPRSRTLAIAKLKHWADVVCKRVTYLLEQLGPLEVDAELETVLARSVPPQRDPNQIRFYEVLFEAPGTLRLARYQAIPGQTGRTRIVMQMTREVAEKLANDLEQTVGSL